MCASPASILATEVLKSGMNSIRMRSIFGRVEGRVGEGEVGRRRRGPVVPNQMGAETVRGLHAPVREYLPGIGVELRERLRQVGAEIPLPVAQREAGVKEPGHRRARQAQ